MDNRTLSENYRKALAALKDQAAAVNASLIGDKDGAGNLADAQDRMDKVHQETSHIVELVMNQPLDSAITIPDMTETDLASLLAGEACVQA